MAIIDVLRDVCTVIGLARPSAVYGSDAREHVELQALANEMAQRIAFDSGHDWARLKTLATLTGDGVSTMFALPADYKRMLKKASLYPSWMPYTVLTHYTDSDEWLSLSVQDFTPVVGAWTLIGSTIGIVPAVASLATVKFYYLTSLIIDPASGANTTLFTLDTDAFVLDERVLKLGITWQWKANKGRPYAEDMANYETALAQAIGADKGSTYLTLGPSRHLWAETFAYPGVLGP